MRDPETIAPDSMLMGYLAAALFADYPEDGPDFGSRRRDDDFSDPSAFAPDELVAMLADCERFQELADDHLRVLSELTPGYGPFQLGADFWLSRNGHGAGYFDRPGEYDGPEETWEALQTIAEQFGPLSLELDDAGKVVVL